jgi:membrane fusion protein, multidrug efflux system
VSISKKSIFISIFLSIALVVCLGFWKFIQIKGHIAEAAKFGPPPEAVTTFTVSEKSWTVERKGVGTVKPVQGAMLGFEDAGRISAIHLDSGSIAKNGDVIIELDTKVEVAELAAAQAELQRAESALQRESSLRKRGANSQDDLERAQKDSQTAKALVESWNAKIERRKVRAPFDGVLGIRDVNIGDMVAQGDKAIALQDLTQVYVTFSLPQRDLGVLTKDIPLSFKCDAFPEQEFSGKLTSYDSIVDPSTRTINVQGIFRNTSTRLLPGMFGLITLQTGEVKKVLPIPATSVSYAPYGDSVYVVKDKDAESGLFSIKQKNIVVRERKGDFVEVTGLNEGDRIVASGVFKLRPDAKIIIRDDLAPEYSLEPKPENT